MPQTRSLAPSVPEKKMSTRFFTNDGENTLLKKFAGVFAHNPDIERFDALVGYLRSSGYFALRPHLEKVPIIRILVGIDVDAFLAQQHRKGLLLLGDADKTIAAVRKALETDVQRAPYRREVEDGILQFVADVVTRRVEIPGAPHQAPSRQALRFSPQRIFRAQNRGRHHRVLKPHRRGTRGGRRGKQLRVQRPAARLRRCPLRRRRVREAMGPERRRSS